MLWLVWDRHVLHCETVPSTSPVCETHTLWAPHHVCLSGAIPAMPAKSLMPAVLPSASCETCDGILDGQRILVVNPVCTVLIQSNWFGIDIQSSYGFQLVEKKRLVLKQQLHFPGMLGYLREKRGPARLHPSRTKHFPLSKGQDKVRRQLAAVAADNRGNQKLFPASTWRKAVDHNCTCVRITLMHCSSGTFPAETAKFGWLVSCLIYTELRPQEHS